MESLQINCNLNETFCEENDTKKPKTTSKCEPMTNAKLRWQNKEDADKTAKTVDLLPKKDKRGEGSVSSKNQITGTFGARKVCMNVCNPPYYNQEYPPSYGSQPRPAWNQNYMPGSGGYDNPADYGQNVFPSYDNLEDNQFQLQGDFGDYIASCYRNMFKRKYRLDPGFLKPSIYNYQSIFKSNYGARRNRNHYQEFMNCQLICYPVMVPSYEPLSTTTTKETTSESNETTEETTSTTRKRRKPTAKNGKKFKRHK